jgi:hypothetical protein
VTRQHDKRDGHPISQTARTGTPVLGPIFPRTPVGRRVARTARCNGRSVRVRRPQDRNPRRGPAWRPHVCRSGHRRSIRDSVGWPCFWLIDAEKHLSGHSVECGHNPSLRNHLCKRLRARGGMGDNEFGVASVHRERAAYDDLARQIARPIQNVLDSGPVHGQQKGVRFLRGLTGCPRPRVPTSVPHELLQLLLAASVTENHLMPRTCEERPEFATHQPRTKNANSHVALPRLQLLGQILSPRPKPRLHSTHLVRLRGALMRRLDRWARCGACGPCRNKALGRRRGSARVHYEAPPGAWLTTLGPTPNANRAS